MDKSNFVLVGNTITFIGVEKQKPHFLIVLNGRKFDNFSIDKYYSKMKAFGEFIEVLPGIYYKESKKWQENFWMKWCHKLKSTESIVKKFACLACMAVTKLLLFERQKVVRTIEIRNKRDVIYVFNSSYNDKEKVYSSNGVRSSKNVLSERLSCKYDIEVEFKYVDTSKIIYPDTLGGGARKCIIWDIFQTTDLMSTCNPLYQIYSTMEMFEASSQIPSLLEECEKFKSCKYILEKFRNGTYVADEASGYDNIELEDFNGYFSPHEGKHRVCIAKRFKIPQVYARVSKMIKISEKEQESENRYINLFRERHYDVEEVLNDCYSRFKEVGLNSEQVRYALNNGLSNAELLTYIEQTTGKTLENIARDIEKNRENTL
ncbi:MAG: hypothetical protein N2645_15395 [Clostridia bacterium]|nr:hypothetical protein [Clostridia bacterium]